MEYEMAMVKYTNQYTGAKTEREAILKEPGL